MNAWPGTLVDTWLLSFHERPLSPLPLSRHQITNYLSFSVFLHIAGPAYWQERGEGAGLEPNQYERKKAGLWLSTSLTLILCILWDFITMEHKKSELEFLHF